MKTIFVLVPSLAKALSGKSSLRYLYNLFTLAFFSILTRLFKLKLKFTFNFEFNELRFSLTLNEYSDLNALKEVFVDKEYEWFPIEDPKVIIDLGAHFGDTALYYHARFPNAKILAVEPSPSSFVRLSEHVKGIEKIIPIHAAIGVCDGETVLNMMPSSLGHSTLNRAGAINGVTVKEISLASLFGEHNISKADYIKFDIEGKEFDVFETIDPSEYSGVYIGEVHEDLTGKTIETFKNYFKDKFQLQVSPLPKKGRFTFRAK